MQYVQLWLLIHGSWHSIPISVNDFHLFTTYPLRWLIFLGYTIYGCQGTLKANPEGPELDNYMVDVGNSNNHYYYIVQVGNGMGNPGVLWANPHLLGDAPLHLMFPPIFLRHLYTSLLIVANSRWSTLTADRVHSQLRYL